MFSQEQSPPQEIIESLQAEADFKMPLESAEVFNDTTIACRSVGDLS
jgi:hypothetical protein